MCQTQPGRGLQLLLIGQAVALGVSLLELFGGNGGILGLVSTVLILISLNQLKSVQKDYGKAFTWSIMAFVFAVVVVLAAVVLAIIPFLSLIVVPIATLGSMAISFLIVYYTCTGTKDLLAQAGDMENGAMADTVIKIYFLCAVVSLIFGLLSFIPLLGAVFKLLNAVTNLAQMMGHGLFVYFLYKAMKTFTA